MVLFMYVCRWLHVCEGVTVGVFSLSMCVVYMSVCLLCVLYVFKT